jgi:enamine deaminase RidA (YjgF/YER057c/UK114 family)
MGFETAFGLLDQPKWRLRYCRAMKASEKLVELGLELPAVATPAGVYVPAVVAGEFVFTSGQLPFVDGALPATGLVGADLDVAAAASLARIAVLNALAAAADAVGGIDNIVRVVKLLVFVASAPTFTDQPLVANGASDALVEIFGDAGRHARSAVGVPVLPRNTPVEIEMIAQVRNP